MSQDVADGQDAARWELPTIVGFVPTPIDAEGAVEAPRLEVLAAHLSRFNILPATLGGMGEFYALDRVEARTCMEALVGGAAGRAQTVAGIGFATREAVCLAEDAADAGISTLVINPPHHANPSPKSYAEHVRCITESSGLPAVVYSSVKYPLTDSHLEALLKVPGFKGVKEEFYDVEAATERIRHYGDRVEWWGVGEVGGLPYVNAGAKVITTSLACYSPGLAREFIAQSLLGKVDPEIEESAAEWQIGLSFDGDGAVPFMKEVMRQTRGWNDAVRLPLRSPNTEVRELVERYVARFAGIRDLVEGI